MSAAATDGSGWKLTASFDGAPIPVGVATSPSGWQYGPAITDTNGNQVTVGIQNGVYGFIDSLGLLALSTSTGPMQYNYTNPSGGN